MRWPEHSYEGENLKRLTESVLTKEQRKSIITDYVKENIDKKQDRGSADWDETVKHIISECSRIRHIWI